MIQKTVLSKRDMKKLTREVNLAEATMAITPEYLNWSEQNITFSRADHPPSVPRPGHAALVVEAQSGEFQRRSEKSQKKNQEVIEKWV